MRSLAACFLTASANAVTVSWDTGTPGSATYSWFNPSNWSDGALPVDGTGNIADLEVDNVQRTYDINNGGAGVNLPNSQIDIGRGVYEDSSGSDDSITADEIRFNGAGGQAPTMNVSFTASTISSNRHGAIINAPWSANTILAQSGHQDKWSINASPTGIVNTILLDENRGPDGGTIDGFFETNVDMAVNTIDHVWSSLEVGDAGATLAVGTYNYTFYDNNPNNAPNNQNLNPVALTGNMLVTNFNMIDIADGTPMAQSIGTYGSIGSGADNQVPWITGDGILTVIPEPGTALLALLGGFAFGVRRKRIA